jgi:hypothetical protein
VTPLLIIGFLLVLVAGFALVGSGRDRRHRYHPHGEEHRSYGTGYTAGGTFGGAFTDGGGFGGGGGGDCGGGGGGGGGSC